MNKLFLFSILFLLGACRDPQINTPTSNSEISFDANGTHAVYAGEQTIANGGIGVFATKATGIPGGLNTIYSFGGASGNNSNFLQLLVQLIPPDTLKVKSYLAANTTGSQFKMNDQVHALLNPSDQLIINITSYQNGVVNGTFSGNVTKIISITPMSTQPVLITNGVIKDVKIKY